jgi:Icc-related predicted phosphoesterase
MQGSLKKPASDLFIDKMVDNMRFKIAFVSDYHMAPDRVEKLKLWYMARESKDINLVICGGDFDNLSEQSHLKTAENNESEARIASFLTFLEFFCCPIYYVPGNHDPPTMFKSDDPTIHVRTLTQFSHNVHTRMIKLSKGLSICGVGGCVPAKEINTKTGEIKSIWEGYPYVKDEHMKPDLDILQKLVDETEDQVIFLTHDGPDILSTTLQLGDDGIQINAGSASVSQFFLKNREKLLMVLHGHVHAAQGMHKDWNCSVINPGSLKDGNFGIIEVAVQGDGKWRLQTCQFIDLDAIN